MFKRFLFLISLFLVQYTFGQDSLSQVEFHGKLQVQGAKIIGENHGNPVQLRGMSMFWSQWSEGSKYYRADIVNQLVDDWKINVIRASMGVDEGTLGYINNPALELARVKTIIDAAIDRGIYVIVDWHSHVAEEQEEEAKAFFAQIAQEYGDYPNIIYEIYNEPTSQAWRTTIKPYCEAVIDSIRIHDTGNLVICGTRTWSQRVDEVVNNEINDPNVAYTLHYYAASHGQSLRNIAQRAINNGIPIFVTEFGTCEASGAGRIDFEESNIWWDFLEDNDISWCNWSISDKNEAASALMPNSTITGNWNESNYTTSGAFVRDKLRNDYQQVIYDNNMNIEISSGYELLYTDRPYAFDLNLFNEDTLVNRDSVTYYLEVSDGGSITNEGVFTPNGESGSFKLYIEAVYDTLRTTKTITFAITDVIPSELSNSEDKTYLALTNIENEYKLSSNIEYPIAIDTLTPNINDLVTIDNQSYAWEVTNESSGAFSVADSAVKSYLAIYITNPIPRSAKINVTQVGTSTLYINGASIGVNTFNLIKGENLLLIEFEGTVDSSYFDFLITDIDGDTLPYLSYTTTGSGTFDCNKTYKGEAYLADCGCIGGNTLVYHCPGPFNGSPATIPGRIQAQEYDWGPAGVTHYDETIGNNGDFDLRTPDNVDISNTTDQGGIASIGWIDTGEWLSYTVEVATTGKYTVDFRVATAMSGSLMLSMDETDLYSSNVAVASTGGWTTWRTIPSDTFELSAGIHTLKFESTSGSFNLNYMEFKTANSLGINNVIIQNVFVYPLPFENHLTFETEELTNYQIFDLQGNLMEQGSCNGNCSIGQNISSGMFILEIRQNEKINVKRIIKQ